MTTSLILYNQHPKKKRKQQDPTVLLFCISVWLLKWRQWESPVNWEIMKYDTIYKTFLNSSLESCVLTVSHQYEAVSEQTARMKYWNDEATAKRSNMSAASLISSVKGCKSRLQGKKRRKTYLHIVCSHSCSFVCQQGNKNYWTDLHETRMADVSGPRIDPSRRNFFSPF